MRIIGSAICYAAMRSGKRAGRAEPEYLKTANAHPTVEPPRSTYRAAVTGPNAGDATGAPATSQWLSQLSINRKELPRLADVPRSGI
jgi:hypothetical protein